MATPRLRWTIAWLALAVALIGARPARADVFDDNPATASRRAGELYVFARSADGALYERHRTDGNWSDWNSLGGSLTSGPAAIAYGPDILVFARGTDGQVYQRTLNTDKWGDWVALGGYATSAPAVTVRHGASGYIDLAVRGSDNTIYQRTWTPKGGWTGFVSLGGNLTSAPTLNSQGADILNVFARGVDGQVVQRAWNGTAWSDWVALGGGIIGAPAAVTRTEPYVNVYARGAGNATYARVWNGAGWSDWLLLDNTPIDSSPAGAGDGPDHEWIVARRGNGLLLKEWTSAAGWANWQDMGPIALPAPPPTPATPAPVTLPDSAVDFQTGLRCTPAGGRLRVSLAIKKPKGKAKPRVTKIVFFTKGKGRRVQVDSKAPFQVHIQINRPAGTKGRVYARVYYKRTAHGKVHRKVVSRRYTVCR